MISVVVDIDDTLVNTDRRKWAVWRHILGREIPLQIVERASSRQVLERFTSADSELWKRFWRVLLCWEEAGIRFLELDEPIPFAAEVLNSWSRECKLVYLTGRTKNMHHLTLDELRRFGFPVDEADLVMTNREDLESYLASLTSVDKIRARFFSSLSKQYKVIRVVDDYPNYFTIYRQFRAPDRIGLLRPKRFSTQDYFTQGATRVIESWKQLQDKNEIE